MSVLLAHGASGSPASMAPWVDGLRDRGVAGRTVRLPRGSAERAIVPFASQVPDEPGAVIGGRSFGGRVAMSYPLHRPGGPDASLARTDHWPAIDVPVLLLSGDRDPFARIDLLRLAVPRLRDGRLVVYPRLGHDLKAVREEALDEIAAFVRSLG